MAVLCRNCGELVAELWHFFMPVLFFSLFSLCLFDIKASKWSKTGQKWVCRLARNTYKNSFEPSLTVFFKNVKKHWEHRMVTTFLCVRRLEIFVVLSSDVLKVAKFQNVCSKGTELFDNFEIPVRKNRKISTFLAVFFMIISNFF